MNKIKIIKFIIIIGVFAVGIFLFKENFSNYRNIAWAEDDESENERESDEDSSPNTVIDTNPDKKSSKKTETVTIYKKLNDTVTQIVTTITKHDSDGDGIYDDEDSHPAINEYFIVRDDNLNGIDDRYEQ